MLAKTPLDQLALPAAQLGINEHERAALIRVHDMLCSGEIPSEGFDMLAWQRESECGTVACIAGWANIIDGNAFRGVGTSVWIHSLKGPLSRLFMPEPRMREFTQARAAHALYAFLTTGEADWRAA